MTTRMQAFQRISTQASGIAGMFRAATLGLGLLVVGAAWAGPAVTYVATDVSGNNWRYDYTITGPVDAFGAINLIFSHLRYSNLVSSSLDSNLTLLDTQPDPILPADGIVHVTPDPALLATDTTTASVDFVWLGATGTAPGAQAFEILNPDFNVTFSGQTVPAASNPNPTPEPTAASLVAAALLALALSRRCGKTA